MKIIGINALVYIGAPVAGGVPERNNWTLTVTRELQEARVFSSADASSAWVEQEGGFRSWSGSISGYYTDEDETIANAVVGNSSGKKALWLYEDRGCTTNYWYGVAWFDLDQNTSVDGYAELNADFTGSGQLYRFSA